MQKTDTVTCYTPAGEAVQVQLQQINLRPEVYGVAFTEDRGQVLLRRAPGADAWQLPGGEVLRGEPIRETLARIFSAGLGLQATAGEPMYFGEQFAAEQHGSAPSGRHLLKLFFLTYPRGNIDPRFAETAGGGGAAWVPIEELDALAISDDDYDAVQRALQWLELSEGPSLASADDDDGD